MRSPPNPAKLETSRDVRVARRQLERQEHYLGLLQRAEQLRTDGGQPAEAKLRDLISAGETERLKLLALSGGRIFPRRRPTGRVRAPERDCMIFLDECGAHSVVASDAFPIFVLAAVIIPKSSYPDIDVRWRAWKATHLGSQEAIVHEPDVRKGDGYFDLPNKGEVLNGLAQELAGLDFTVVACAVHRPDYRTQFGTSPLDQSLPAHLYLMTLDFLFERVAMALDLRFSGSRAEIVAESRGPREDALLQYEFARLHLEGTSYISDGWFRQVLHPGIRFEGKETNSTGLQLADLVARPCGEKIADPSVTPDRWPEVRSKLCPGKETKHSIVGLKIVPWHDRYDDLWTS
jgi:Protein of unknown function (DUF3800)